MSSQKKILRLILGDQLNIEHSWFKEKAEPYEYILMEVREEASYVRHHIQKLVAFFSAMRLFRDELKQRGFSVRYLKLDDPENRQSLAANLEHLLKSGTYSGFEYQQADEYRVRESLRSLSERISVSASIPTRSVSSEHFLVEPEFFSQVFKGHKRYVMESFYRAVRLKYNLLLEGGKPLGGRWNFDAENRSKLPKGTLPPAPLVFKHNVEEVLDVLRKQKIDSLGSIKEKEFPWPLTRAEALATLDYFCEHLLPQFGMYQDAMSSDFPFLFHSRLSFSLNVKHISPLEVAERAIKAYRERPSLISLPQVEGFVRQIVGWREFMRGVYWAEMPEYKQLNVLGARRKLPDYFWTGQSKMRCLQHAIGQSLSEGYAHHIQRLMITGNFLTLCGVDPAQVDEWYLGIYIDALEWVQLPNTRGMSQYADGGIVATKPYTSSAAYINKMSNYCSGCHYNYKERLGPKACPFNALYWHFLLRHQSLLEKNPRIGMGYQQLKKMPEEEKQALSKKAEEILEQLENL